jgi:V/A-type H+-transporting ATPase subunit D
MAKKIKLTRPELKRYRDELARFQRYLPMLKLKQQQLQMTLRDIQKAQAEAHQAVEEVQQRFDPYRAVLKDLSGINIRNLATPEQVRTSEMNIAGVTLPVFDEAIFPEITYSLFATPAWVDRALADMRELNRRRAQVEVLDRQYELLQKELTKIIQRVNLFEKVMIPDAKEAIRKIRIKLGDEMTAAVGRAKIAKSKLAETVGSAVQDTQAETGAVAADTKPPRSENA